MKKIKLFLAAIAAMVTMGANAQSWTASNVGEGDFYLYNVGTGQFFTKGNGWGTQAMSLLIRKRKIMLYRQSTQMPLD